MLYYSICTCIEQWSSLSPCNYIYRLNGGELFDYVVEKDYLAEKEASDYLQQLLQAIEYFHQNKIVHLDLKVSV